MKLKNLYRAIERFIRTGSLQFMRGGTLNHQPSQEIAVLKWKGRELHYRPNSSDAILIYDVLIRPSRAVKPGKWFTKKLEYWVPKEVEPKVILDIGGNIGVTALYYANRYPEATIYSFEPVPSNYELLAKNTASFSNIKTFPFGLGNSNETLTIYPSSDEWNHGGFTLHQVKAKSVDGQVITVRNINEVLKELGIEEVDLIKIDTEGAEHDILTALDEGTLKKAQWIIGELHGQKDFALLNYLSQFFSVGVEKKPHRYLSFFNAYNPSKLKKITWR